MNLRNQTVLPNEITNRLQAMGMVDVKGVDPLSVLIPRVLDEQLRCPTTARLDATGAE